MPGEHDVFLDGGKEYLSRYGQGTVGGRGWQSFDYKGTHVVGLVNVLKYKGEGMGSLGDEQIAWLEKYLAPLGSSTPIVIFSHVLNGHIHQVLRKVEGSIAFHTAMSTAFPQPAPGSAPAPGPMKIPEAEARRMIGITDVTYVPGQHPLAVVDSTLG